ncbi:MAG: 16S rRNA (cytidine(1402)-2'-O)-methyltransferase, partial [Actinobacteria bacterium]|nr:16S rRNA (cytidine(1402)-2'-O)-methyltransferase [Actinomycetota bacterium]
CGSRRATTSSRARRTGTLLSRAGVSGPRLRSFFEGNEKERVPELVEALRAGRDVALVTDAGMPGVSDPGYRLVAACAEAGIEVRVVPGPSAVLAALAVSGLPTDRFAFEGFLPKRVGERTARLAELAGDPRTLVLFESPRRVGATLGAMAEAFGPERRVALCRELTKLHEEVVRGTVADVLAEVERRGELKGEVVLVVEGAGGGHSAGRPSLGEIAEEAARLVAGGMRPRQAAAEAAHRHGAKPNAVYRALLDREP